MSLVLVGVMVVFFSMPLATFLAAKVLASLAVLGRLDGPIMLQGGIVDVAIDGVEKELVRVAYLLTAVANHLMETTCAPERAWRWTGALV